MDNYSGSTVFFSNFNTPWGFGQVAATDQGIAQVRLPGDPLFMPGTAEGRQSAVSRTACQQLEEYFLGKLRVFTVPVDLSACTPYRQQVLRMSLQIPYGAVVSYGQLARMLSSRSARAVGGALASNPVPIIVPCHRVVSVSGALTGYSGSGGLVMKRSLLALEGVEFKDKNCCLKCDSFKQHFF